MLIELIQKEHSCKKLKSNERGVYPVLPDFAHIRKQLRNFNTFDSNRAFILDIILSINLTILSSNGCSKLTSFVVVERVILSGRARGRPDGAEPHLKTVEPLLARF
jgi:hypothetical protein